MKKIFLCSRVSEPTHEDLEKLRRVLKYLNGTSHLGLLLGKYGSDMALTVYADASYAVRKDRKSHGGVVAYLRRGPVFVKRAKHKMTSKSSAEAELITLSDAASRSARARSALLPSVALNLRISSSTARPTSRLGGAPGVLLAHLASAGGRGGS